MEGRQQKNARFLETATRIAGRITEDDELIGLGLAAQFESRVNRIQKHMDEVTQEGRTLKIGILGTVKAGKSSFLNALIFDGNRVLPEAATPMTAALTRISYAEKPYAEITFYQDYDWANIRKRAKGFEDAMEREWEKRRAEYERKQKEYEHALANGAYRVPEPVPPTRDGLEGFVRTRNEEKYAAWELTKTAEQSGLNVLKYLGTKVRLDFDDSGSMMQSLQEYVGAGGRYTPIVNYTDLHIHNEMLRGLVVVDTPGLNDPIVSRGTATRDYLGACDVALIVSAVTQFLTAQDVELIERDLTGENILSAYIIGSQIDVGLLQYNKRNSTFEDAYYYSVGAYKQQAQNALSGLRATGDSPLFRRIQKSPEFVSSLMFSVAKKKEAGQALEVKEKRILDQFQRRFPDFSSVFTTPDDYFNLSNIRGVRENVYGQVLQEKDALIQERIASYRSGQTVELLRQLNAIRAAVQANLENLQSGDMAKLEAKKELLTEKLNSIRRNVSAIFDRQASVARKGIQDIKVNVAQILNDYQDIQVERESKEHTDTVRTGFLGLWKKEVRRIETTYRAKPSEVVDNLVQYGTKTQEITNRNLGMLFDPEKLKKDLTDCVIGAFDLASREFQPDEILVPLETLLNKLTVKNVEYGFVDEVRRNIYTEFPDDQPVEGNNIHRLKRVQQEQMHRIMREAVAALDKVEEDITNQMALES
ncbi:MAG: dynamin family protein, partial [Oscillibacter sp.]|nr:dynamin family protein [Oscillibacter sp.]